MGLNAMAIDLIGWGFAEDNASSMAEIGPDQKRENLYQFWKKYIKEPMVRNPNPNPNPDPNPKPHPRYCQAQASAEQSPLISH